MVRLRGAPSGRVLVALCVAGNGQRRAITFILDGPGSRDSKSQPCSWLSGRDRSSLAQAARVRVGLDTYFISPLGSTLGATGRMETKLDHNSGASCPWNLSTVPTCPPGATVANALAEHPARAPANVGDRRRPAFIDPCLPTQVDKPPT
jgi:hypothetical protein